MVRHASKTEAGLVDVGRGLAYAGGKTASADPAQSRG